jgi:hypothetical protein
MAREVTLINGIDTTLPKGTKLIINNPNWDSDKPETHYDIEVELRGPVNIILDGRFTVRKLNRISPKG